MVDASRYPPPIIFGLHMERLQQLLDEAQKGTCRLSEPHKSGWFISFVKRKGLSASEHQGLWWRVMMRSTTCRKDVPVQGEEAGSSTSTSMRSPNSNDDVDDNDAWQCTTWGGAWEPEGLAIVLVYPCYDYIPPKATVKDTRRTEQVVHDYMVRMGKLPKPLPHIKCQAECAALIKVLGRHCCAPHVETADGFVGRDDALKALARAAAMSMELLVVLRGHGLGAASLVMSNGTKLSPGDIKQVMHRVSFRGRILCVFNMCHADSDDPAASEACAHTAQAGVAWDDAEFEWATLHSSGAKEQQLHEHGHAVMEVLANVLACKGLPWSITQTRVDEAWTAVQKQMNESKPLLATATWLPPKLRCSRGW